MKRVIDRTFAVKPFLQNKTFYMLSTGAAPEEAYMKTMIDSFNQYVSCFCAGRNKIGCYLFGYNTRGLNDINEMPVLEEAYRLGKSV